MSSKLDDFGEVFISEVRDNTLETFEKMFDGSMRGMTAEKVRDKISIFDEQEKILWKKVMDYQENYIQKMGG